MLVAGEGLDQDLAEGGATRPAQSSPPGNEGHKRDSGHGKQTGEEKGEEGVNATGSDWISMLGSRRGGELLPSPLAMRLDARKNLQCQWKETLTICVLARRNVATWVTYPVARECTHKAHKALNIIKKN